MEGWNVTRRGRSLRVDVGRDALHDGHEETIVRAVEAEASEDDFDSVRVSGTLLDQPAQGTKALLRRIGEVARRHGKRMDIGPI